MPWPHNIKYTEDTFSRGCIIEVIDVSQLHVHNFMKGIWYQILEQFDISLATTKTSHPHSHPSDLSQNVVKYFFIKCLVFLIKAASLKTRTCYIKSKTLCQINEQRQWEFVYEKDLMASYYRKLTSQTSRFLKFLPTRVSLVKIFNLMKKSFDLNYFNKSIVLFKKNNANNMEIFFRSYMIYLVVEKVQSWFGVV